MSGALLRNSLIILGLLMMFGCRKNVESANGIDDGLPHLNLTVNALWDEPALKESNRSVFHEKIAEEYDGKLVDFVERVNKGAVSLKEMQHVHDSLAGSESVYAGYLRLIILNRIMVDTPAEKFSKEFVMKCLDEGYAIAEGESPVPQSLFFYFWENCMVEFSNANAYDEVSNQAQKLLEICERQNLPMGVMYSYRALAGNLQDHYDYKTALMEYENADSVARTCMPKLLGTDWLTPGKMKHNLVESHFMLGYVDMIQINSIAVSILRTTTG